MVTSGDQQQPAAEEDAALVGRLVTRGKWDRAESSVPIPADVAADLRISGNTVSFWKCGTATQPRLADVVLAMALAPTSKDFDRVDVVAFERDKLSSIGVDTKDTAGQTLAASLTDKHLDAVNLSVYDVPKIAELIDAELDGGRCKRFSRADVANLIDMAQRDGVIEETAIPYELLTKLKAYRENLESNKRKKQGQ